MAGIFEYRLANSWITKAALEASDSYLIERFPIQWDQSSLIAVPWLSISDDGTTYPDALTYVRNTDGSAVADGWTEWVWNMAFLSEGMINYFKSTTFNNSLNSLCTIKTRIKAGSSAVAMFACYQGYMSLPPDNQSERIQGGALSYKLTFYNMTLLS